MSWMVCCVVGISTSSRTDNGLEDRLFTKIHLEQIKGSRKSYIGYRNLPFAGCTFLGGVNICTFCQEW